MSKGFVLLVLASLVLTLALTTLSAYIRLSKSGLGCDDWPACYGRIGPAESEKAAPADVFARLSEEAARPHAWAERAHRAVAGTLGLLIVVINLLALAGRGRRGGSIPIALSLLGVTVFLASLGIWSGSLHRPAVVMGNLLGGMAMLALLWWLSLSLTAPPTAGPAPRPAAGRVARFLVALGVALVVLQIGLGGLTSANFAALSCATFPDCHGDWLPSADLLGQVNVFRELPVGSDGTVAVGASGRAIHMAHRLGAAISLVFLGGLGVVWLADGRYRLAAAFLLFLLMVQAALGIASVLFDLPIAVVTAHNAVAAALLLSALTLYYRVRESRTYGQALQAAVSP